VLAGTTGKDAGLQERAAGLAASSGLGAGVEQGLGEQLRNRLWLRSARR
jgi:hypothetical protein